MFIKKITLFFLFFLSAVSYAEAPKKVTAHCPAANELVRTDLSLPWAKYRYTGYSNIVMPEVSNQLYFYGDSNAEKVNHFSGATWTDSTFLCLYDYEAMPVIIFENQLAPFVNRCYFEHVALPGSECLSGDPASCQLTCELK